MHPFTSTLQSTSRGFTNDVRSTVCLYAVPMASLEMLRKETLKTGGHSSDMLGFEHRNAWHARLVLSSSASIDLHALQLMLVTADVLPGLHG